MPTPWEFIFLIQERSVWSPALLLSYLNMLLLPPYLFKRGKEGKREKKKNKVG